MAQITSAELGKLIERLRRATRNPDVLTVCDELAARMIRKPDKRNGSGYWARTKAAWRAKKNPGLSRG